jgi:hypothetical protein
MSRTKKSTAAGGSEDDTSLGDIVHLLKAQGEQLKTQGEQLATITQQMSKVDKIESEVKDLKTLIVGLREENRELKGQLKEKDKVIEDMSKAVNNLEDRLNHVEQHHRGWGARVLNVPVSDVEAADPVAMINKVFDLALRPILEGAVRSGRLDAVPLASQVLEVAHVLPGKPGQPRPIIMRFYSRNIRSLCFQFKRDFAPREQLQQARAGGEGESARGRFAYPLYDDLTKPTLNKMRAISQDDRAQACWTVNGKIHFKLKNSENVRKVVSIMDPLDLILK